MSKDAPFIDVERFLFLKEESRTGGEGRRVSFCVIALEVFYNNSFSSPWHNRMWWRCDRFMGFGWILQAQKE
jgi:hypothetical protein